MIAAAIKIIMIATATKVPATFPVLAQNPPLLSSFWATTVLMAGGGAVGVIVRVLMTPVTVSTEVHGVGVHDELDVYEEGELVVGERVVGVEVLVETEDVLESSDRLTGTIEGVV